MACDALTLANAGVRGLQPYQPGKPIEELQRELGLSDIIKLASNENPLGAGAAAQAAYQAAAADLALYPDGSGFRLKQALAAKLGVDAAQITLGNGSNDLLDLLGRIFLSPSASVVFSEYAFVVYPITAQATGARPLVVPARDWGHDLEAMAAAIQADTRLVFIANPNNPTGTWLTQAAIRDFLTSVPENVIVVLDEAYFEYGDEASDGVALLADFPNLVVTRTFSKAYGLAALRVGYSISSLAMADLLNRLRMPFNVSSPALAAAEAALSDVAHLQQSVAINRAGREQLMQGFAELGLTAIPSAGNFVAVELPVVAAEVYQRLLAQGVIVRPVGVYGLPRHLRISVGLPEQNSRLLQALAIALKADA